MKCSKAKKLFSGYLDGELKSSQKGFLEDHLNSCPNCRYELARLRASLELIHDLPEVAAPKNFWTQVSEKITIEDGLKKKRKKKTVKWFFPGERLRAGIALAAVLVLVLGISSLIYSSTIWQGPVELLSKKTTPENNETYKLSLPAQSVPEKSAFTGDGEAPALKTEESSENNEQTQLDKLPAEENNRYGGSGDSASITAQNNPALGSAKEQVQKRIITRISLKLKTDQNEKTVTRLNTLAGELNGRIESGIAQDNSSQLELTVPADRVSDALVKIESLGEISDKKQEEQDVTEEYLILQEQEEKLRQEKEELTVLNNNSGGANEGTSAHQEELNKIQLELDQTSLGLKKLTEEMNSVHFLISIIK
ncbi:MAG: hypothetical protein XD84_0337 [Desulfotomaculum sp. 46_80]|nr:MAG: hypothetical protein XD84_0337 [Desulfotomaculum sp. 46_80]HAU31222.1 hypothetical protein [Desulfotomaculum sp.]